ncbi:MAG TPA: hypothetical protein VK821_20635 [Dehalococcoidia bacterium]|nr:hypothetical protein [Dehalococcoidia bacterium]
MRLRYLHALALLALLLSLGASACRTRPTEGSSTPAAPTLQTKLDTVFSSPSGLYTLRYNHSWQVQQIVTEAGVLDLFTLPNATISVETERVPPGTKLDALIEQTLAQYRSVNIQGLERAGSINVGGGHGELVHAVTYVNAQGVTVASAPAPGSRPRNLSQAFYLAGTQRFTFSVAWPQGDGTDYMKLFRSILQTFTLAGTT